MLIGENRPYCTALLWTEQEIPNLESQIETMNESLSHPEQIRSYRVIEKPLSIKEGELTPNLKVKRADATILPKSMGNPPILTIMALAKKIAGVI